MVLLIFHWDKSLCYWPYVCLPGEEDKMDEAGALPQGINSNGIPEDTDGGGEPSETDAAIAMAMAATKDSDLNIEIDEDLFDGEDLDAVEEDLETLDLDDWCLETVLCSILLHFHHYGSGVRYQRSMAIQ